MRGTATWDFDFLLSINQKTLWLAVALKQLYYFKLFINKKPIPKINLLLISITRKK